MTTPAAAETAALIKKVMATIGFDDPVTLGNAATGEQQPLPAAVANQIRQLLASLAAGREVNITEVRDELTPNEAAEFLNVSRTYVKKLLDAGDLPYRTVGSHHRIPRADLDAYKQASRARSRAAMEEIYALDRELGLDTYHPSPEENPLVDKNDL